VDLLKAGVLDLLRQVLLLHPQNFKIIVWTTDVFTEVNGKGIAVCLFVRMKTSGTVD
jgi:hypothetical protein